MKRTLLFSLSIIMFIALSCSNRTEEAISFNDNIVKDQKLLLSYEDKVTNDIYNWSNYETAKMDLKELEEACSNMQKKYEELKPFDKEDEFRLAMIELCKSLYESSTRFYPEIIKYLAIPNDVEIIESDYAKMDSLLGVIDNLVNPINQKFIKAQETFASRYKFNFEKNSTTEK